MRQSLAYLVCLMSLGGCGDKSRPMAIPLDAEIPDRGTLVLPDGFISELGVQDTHTLGDSPPGDRGGIDAGGADGPPGDVPRDVLRDVLGEESGPPSPLCGFTESQLNRLAVRIAGCTSESVQSVVERFWRPESWEEQGVHARDCTALRCAASATDCPTAMFDCLKYGVSVVADGGTCAAAPSCEGDGRRLLTRCDGQRRFTDDCESTGRMCVASATEAACVASGAESCAPGAPPRCLGSEYQRCVAGRYATLRRCGATQGMCDASAGGCVGSGASCTGTEAVCDGTRVARCRNGRIQPLTCSDLLSGSSCRVVGSQAFCGVSGECDPASSAAGPRCEGNTLVLCAGGRSTRYDCTSEGFRGCSPQGCVL